MAAAADKVSAGFNQAESYASAAWSLIQNYINDQTSHTLTFGVDTDIVFDPALTTTELTVEAPTVPDFPDVPKIEDNFTMPDFPANPGVTLPTAPIMGNYTIPEFQSDITISQFSDTVPEIDLTPIAEVDIVSMFSYLVGDFKPQISEVKEILLTRINEGGTGLPADIEADIWNRNLERDQQALQDAVDETTAQWAKMGFTLPDGILAHSVLALNNEYVNKRLDASRDIAIKQAELEQININEALKLVTAIEDSYNGVMVQYANVCTNAMKTAANVALSLHNSVVQYYNLLIDSYKAKSEVYKTLVEARRADAEVYKTRVEGIGQAIAADEAKVRVYVAEIGGEEAKLKAYESELKSTATRIEAMKAWLDMGRTRMELFGAETRALNERYSGQIESFKTALLAWSNNSDRMWKEKDISLRAQTVQLEAKLKQLELGIKNYEWRLDLDLEKMKTVTGVGAHVVAGALAAANVSASISESENTSIQG